MSRNQKIILSIFLVLLLILSCAIAGSYMGLKYVRNSVGIGPAEQTESEYVEELHTRIADMDENQMLLQQNQDEIDERTEIQDPEIDTVIDGVGEMIVTWNFYPTAYTERGRETGSIVVEEKILKDISISSNEIKASISEDIIQESVDTMVNTDSSEFKEFSDGLIVDLEDGHIIFTMKIKGIWATFLNSDHFSIYMIQNGQELEIDKLVIGDGAYDLGANSVMKSYSDQIIWGTNKTISELVFTIDDKDWALDSYQIKDGQIDFVLKRV
jgi:hypothetical protein